MKNFNVADYAIKNNYKSLVKIGSHDGVSGDPFSAFTQNNYELHGVFVEPVKHLFEKGKATYSNYKNIIFKNIAIGEVEGYKDFYFLDASTKEAFADIPLWWDQLGSFNPEHVINTLGEKYRPYVMKSPVLTQPLMTVLNNLPFKHLDILQIDTEGYDWQILKQLNLNEIQPKLLYFEHKWLAPGELEEAQIFLKDHYDLNILEHDCVAFRKSKSIKKSDTCVVMVDTRLPSNNRQEYWSLTAYNNYKYALSNNYDFKYVRPFYEYYNESSFLCCKNPNTGNMRFAAWCKIIVAHKLLQQYKRIVYIDTDALFNSLKSIDAFMEEHSFPKSKKGFFLNDHPFNADSPNSGFFILEQTEEIFNFLKSWYCEQHNDPIFDSVAPWEQSAISYWNLVNQKLFKPCFLLPVNQFKIKNFKSNLSFQKIEDTSENDTEGNRGIINHYFKKDISEIVSDMLKRTDMCDFEEVIGEISNSSIEYFKTKDYSFELLSKTQELKKDITVLVSASYLDSHPEITFIKEVVESLTLTGIPEDTQIILSHDKIKPGIEGFEDKEKAYEEYFKNLQEYAANSKFKNIEILKAPEWGHLTRTLKYAVSQVKTKYMLVLQHDIHIRREIPVLKMLDLMEKYEHIKHLRFNVRRNHPTFMWWDGYKGGKTLFAEEEYDGVKLCVTPAWSDQNHLATKEYYENIVFPDCTNPDGELIYDFMENRLNGMCHHNHSRYGTYIYGEYGAPRTSRHSDGRKSSPEPDED
jgi:hypothetical protein